MQNVLDENEIDMSDEVKKNTTLKKEKDEEKLTNELKNNEAKLHYDKDDLIQFHELMLSKPLVKACSDLDYDHPTIV